MAELVHSIREVGPAPAGRGPPAPAPDALRAGHGRAPLAGRPGRPASTTIPAIVRETDDDDMLRDALLENLHRSQLNPLEEAAAYQQLLEDFGCTHDELAQRIGRSRPQISNTCGCSSSRRPSSAGSPPGCSSPGTPGRCSASRTPSCRTGSPPGWSPRASACAASRRSSRSAATARRRRRPRGATSRSRPGSTDLADRLSDRLRDPGQGRPRPAQGQDHRGVRLARRPAADRGHHGPAQPRATGRSSP